MRRLALIGIAALIAGVAALVIGAVAQGSDTYKFDVIFDDARGLISGQVVKIAGAQAGTISNVVVTPDDKARVEATIKGPFQFHTNASCIIRPDGLIAENYLECDPGTSRAPLLAAKGGYPATVPVTHTSEPVNLLDLFNIFNLPTRERFQALVDELGIATAGDGDQINSILGRANPTLQSAQRVISILDRQTSQISGAIDATNKIAKEGANHTAAVQDFIKQAGSLTQLTANHSSSLEQAINRLPGLLSAAAPALAQLNTVAKDGTPLLSSIHKAVPSLNKVDNDIVPFTKIAKPSLASLSKAISTAIPDAKATLPVVKSVANYLQASKSSTAQFSKLTVNLLQHGWSEEFMSILYYTAGALSKYDSNSHMLTGLLVFPGNGACTTFATKVSSNPACDAHYGQQPGYTPERTPAKQRATTTTTTTTPATTTTATTTNPVQNVVNGVGGAVNQVSSGAAGAVNQVSSGVGGIVNKVVSGLGGGGNANSNGANKSNATGGATGATTTTQSTTSTTGGLSGLLNYLLK